MASRLSIFRYLRRAATPSEESVGPSHSQPSSLRIPAEETSSLATDRNLWHKRRVPIFIERYLLPALATVTILLLLFNPMKFDWTQRITGGLAVLLFAYFLAHTLHLYNKANQTADSSQKVVTATPPVKADVSPGLRVRDHPIIIPSQIGSEKTVVSMQLLPPTYEVSPTKTDIDGVLIVFDNSGIDVERNVAVKAHLPFVRAVECKEDRVKIIAGGTGASFVQLLASELVPNEHHTCVVDFQNLLLTHQLLQLG